MDILSGKAYPAGALSNFAGHRFQIDGIDCNSMEGFLQSLKFKSPDMQVEVCKLVGIGAKRRGRPKKWFRTQKLYWRGETIDRQADEYTELITKAYDCMFRDSESFRNALKASGDSVLRHSIGKNKKSETVLTEREFIGQLNRLRLKLDDDVEE